MKAVVLNGPGEIGMKEIPAPEPGEGWPLIRIKAAGICGSDVNSYQGKGQKLVYPLVLGHEAAGEVVSVSGESKFKPGDDVIIEPYLYCGLCYPCSLGRRNCCEQLKCLGVHTDGTMSEFITHPDDLLHLKPEGMSWEEAAFAEPLTIATHGVHRLRPKSGEYGAIVGAGTIGILTALYLKTLGVVPIMIDVLESRLETARSLGIEKTVLSDGTPPVDEVKRITSGRGAEMVFEISGSISGVSDTLHLASYCGRISLTGWPGGAATLETSLITRKELEVFGSRNSAGEFPEAIELIHEAKIPAAKIITNTIGFNDLPDAIRLIAESPTETLKCIALA